MTLAERLRQIAARRPDVERGVACAGTALESATFKTRKKAFLFVGPKSARLKLDESIAEATKLAKREPARFQVGAHGWTTIQFVDGPAPPAELLERWVAESHRGFAGAAKPKRRR